MPEISYFLIIIVFLWLFRQIRAVLFWLYLWQLKEYHVGRFLDHFRTYKGKTLFLNLLFILKIALLSYALILYFYPEFLAWYFYAGWIFILAALYLLESVRFLMDIVRKTAKKPVLTKKTLAFVFVNLISVILFAGILLDKTNFFYWYCFGILSFDVLLPLWVSFIVLLFQPFTVLWRNKIIKKAKRKREKFKNLLVVGITGSYGKTSTKELLAAILSEKFRVLKTREHQNSEIGIAQCILQDLKPGHEIFVCEMGAYNLGKIREVCSFVKPGIGILTGINEQHMATFGSQENIVRAKYELMESLPENGLAFFNAKNKYCRTLYEKTKIRKFLYGENATFPGEENLLGARLVAGELGMSQKEILGATAKMRSKFGGIETKKGIMGLNVIDATYSANPDGVMAHLEYLKNIFTGRKIIILPCLIELGRASKEVHERIGRKIAETCDLAIITTRDRFREIKQGASGAALDRRTEVLFMDRPKQILEKIKSFCRQGDFVLLESRVPEGIMKQLLRQ
jgi:UDP-N-acetylmuramoyl-tripeptide--D-alanyl-D-alanine ligase